MNTEEPHKPASPAPTPAAGESTIGSGEGSRTALEALIRKRKQQADAPDPAPPAAPAAG